MEKIRKLFLVEVKVLSSMFFDTIMFAVSSRSITYIRTAPIQ